MRTRRRGEDARGDHASRIQWHGWPPTGCGGAARHVKRPAGRIRAMSQVRTNHWRASPRSPSGGRPDRERRWPGREHRRRGREHRPPCRERRRPVPVRPPAGQPDARVRPPPPRGDPPPALAHRQSSDRSSTGPRAQRPQRLRPAVLTEPHPAPAGRRGCRPPSPPCTWDGRAPPRVVPTATGPPSKPRREACRDTRAAVPRTRAPFLPSEPHPKGWPARWSRPGGTVSASGTLLGEQPMTRTCHADRATPAAALLNGGGRAYTVPPVREAMHAWTSRPEGCVARWTSSLCWVWCWGDVFTTHGQRERLASTAFPAPSQRSGLPVGVASTGGRPPPSSPQPHGC